MKHWQKIWLYFLIVASIYHFIRDVLQTLGIETAISTILVKETGVHSGIWNPVNTYIIEIILFLLAVYLLRKNKFGKIGYSTVGIAVLTLIFFFVYWFLV